MRDGVTVGICLARENKPTTLEFRHHNGTVDRNIMKWYVTFISILDYYLPCGRSEPLSCLRGCRRVMAVYLGLMS
jgi:hypothetical protein